MFAINLQALYDIMMKCLVEADMWNTRRLAVPALGTGLLKYPADKVATIMFQCIQEFSSQNPASHLNTVSILVHSSDTSSYKVGSLTSLRNKFYF